MSALPYPSDTFSYVIFSDIDVSNRVILPPGVGHRISEAKLIKREALIRLLLHISRTEVITNKDCRRIGVCPLSEGANDRTVRLLTLRATSLCSL